MLHRSGNPVAREHVAVDLDAEPRPLRHHELPIDELAAFADHGMRERVAQRVGVDHALEGAQRLRRGRKLEAGGDADRAGPADMRRVGRVEARSELGDAPGLGDAARTRVTSGWISPSERSCSIARASEATIVALAGREPDRQMPGEAAIAGVVMRRDRLLEKAIAEIGQRPADDQRIVDVIGPVGIDIECDVVAGELADQRARAIASLSGRPSLTLISRKPAASAAATSASTVASSSQLIEEA